jgi:ATP-dependent Clp protease ATP-binding subunit ClpC
VASADDLGDELLHLWAAFAERRRLGALPDSPAAGHAAEAGFRSAIAEAPDDAVPWLVLADWLAERGDERAEVVRLLGRVRQQPDGPAWLERHFPPPLTGPGPEIDCVNLRTRLAFIQANQESQRHNHEWRGAEHILLGMLAVPGPATAVLESFGIDVHTARRELRRLVPPGPDIITGLMPQTPRARDAFSHAVEEAQALGERTPTPEHLLLGLCRVGSGSAVKVLRAFGVSPGTVCEAVLARLGRDPGPWLRSHIEVW